VTLWTATPVRLEQLMASQIDLLMEKLQQVQAEIEVELAKRREALRYHFENRRIVFEAEVLRLHRDRQTAFTHSLRNSITARIADARRRSR
jgi:DNA anti-recombination protein RmuC